MTSVKYRMASSCSPRSEWTFPMLRRVCTRASIVASWTRMCSRYDASSLLASGVVPGPLLLPLLIPLSKEELKELALSELELGSLFWQLPPLLVGKFLTLQFPMFQNTDRFSRSASVNASMAFSYSFRRTWCSPSSSSFDARSTRASWTRFRSISTFERRTW